jgi:hypothetical protein
MLARGFIPAAPSPSRDARDDASASRNRTHHRVAIGKSAPRNGISSTSGARRVCHPVPMIILTILFLQIYIYIIQLTFFLPVL